jgi:CHAD domain-containing protein
VARRNERRAAPDSRAEPARRHVNERAETLDGDVDVTVERAPPRTLAPEMTVGEAVDAIVGGCLDRLVANESRAADGTDPEGVHQLRVAARRLRSALKLFGPLVPNIVRATLDGELEWFAGALAPARELDVFVDEIVPSAQPSCTSDGASLASVLAHARRHRDAAYAQVVATLASDRYAALKDAIHGLRSAGYSFSRAGGEPGRAARLDEAAGEWAARVLDKLHRQTLKRGRGFRKLDPAGRHKVRVAAKRMRYATDFFEDLYRRKPVRRYADRLRPLQDELGRMNDLATLRRLLADLDRKSGDPAVALGVETLRGWGEREYAALDPGLLEYWRKFKRAEPFWAGRKRQKADGRAA